MPVALATFLGAVAILLLGRTAAALDTARLPSLRPSWKILLIAWGVLLAANVLFGLFGLAPLRDDYRDRYARGFRLAARSMAPTLLMGDYIMSDNAVYRSRDPRRGDIIVFKYPRDERRVFVKRIVALPGEEVFVRGREVHVNGTRLEEPYLETTSAARVEGVSCGYAYGCESTRVPPDSYFVLGDNRENSQDSRYWGFVRREKIVGRVIAIYWSWDGDKRRPRLDRIARRL